MEPEVAFAHSLRSRFFQRVLRQPLPTGVEYQPFVLDERARKNKFDHVND